MGGQRSEGLTATDVLSVGGHSVGSLMMLVSNLFEDSPRHTKLHSKMWHFNNNLLVHLHIFIIFFYILVYLFTMFSFTVSALVLFQSNITIKSNKHKKKKNFTSSEGLEYNIQLKFQNKALHISSVKKT